MKKHTKIMYILFIIIIIFTIFSQVYGSGTINPEDYTPDKLKPEDYEKAFSLTGTILNAIVIVGVVISITMVMVLGIKYMIGSVEERADYKKTMMPMLIGAILLFASSTIVATIYQIVENL